MSETSPPLPIGTKTKWGAIVAVFITGGERYYMIQDKDGGVAMHPCFMVEDDGRETRINHYFTGYIGKPCNLCGQGIYHDNHRQ